MEIIAASVWLSVIASASTMSLTFNVIYSLWGNGQNFMILVLSCMQLEIITAIIFWSWNY
jgi:hypothetical protein